MNKFDLNHLQRIIAARAGVGDGSSYTASLVSAGMGRAAKKLGEEAVETVIAAMENDKAALIAESADLLYHLAVVWHMATIEVEDVLGELARRTHQSGLEEKVSRSSHE